MKSIPRLLSPMVLFAVVFVVVAALALYPDLILPEFALAGRHSDFIYHMVGLLVLTTIALIATGRTTSVILSMAALAILLELLQNFIPGRGVFMSDAVASLLGVGFSWPLLIFAGYLQHRLRRLAPPHQ